MSREVPIGDCLGCWSVPQDGSTQLEAGGFETAQCATCGGRFHVGDSGLVPPHSIPVPLHEQFATAA